MRSSRGTNSILRGVLARLTMLGVASNTQATHNARAAATECSRRRVERDEVAHYLAARSWSASTLASGARPASGLTH